MLYITSDQHFGHKRIIEYCNRPFESVPQMNEYMIEQWNSVVGKQDEVICLGDFALVPKEKLCEIVERLNGTKSLILGNHDKRNPQIYTDAGFRFVYNHPIILENKFILSHYPQPIGEGYVNIYGHIHTNPQRETISPNGVCMCVERWNYKPISFKEIKERISK